MSSSDTPKTILLMGRGIRKEAVAGGAIVPGMLLNLNSSSQLIAHATAKGPAAPLFAVENDIVGKGIDDAYATNDYVQAEYLHSGCQVYGLVAASAAAIVVGDLLESDGTGCFRKRTAESQLTTGDYTFTSAGSAIAQAISAVDNSGNASSRARIKVVIL